MMNRNFKKNYDEEYSLRQILKYLGLICFNHPKHDERFSFISLLIGMLLLGTTVPITIYGLILEYKNPNSKWMPSTTAVVVTFSHYGSLVLASVFTILLSAISYKQMAKMYSYIDSVKNILSIEKYNPWAVYKFVSSLIFCLLFFVIDYMICSQINSNYYWYTPIYLYEFIFLFLLVQVALIACKIKQLFLALNIEISKSLTAPLKVSFASNEQFFDINSSFLFIKPVKKGISLQELCDLHWVLSKGIQQFNKVFGVQLVLYLFSIFVHLIDSPYFIFLALTDDESSSDIYYSVDIIIWSIIHFVQLCTIVIPCGQATSAANDAAFTISKFLNSDTPDEIRDEAKSFLLLLKQHTVVFSACGLFYLEESVITSVTAAVTTYLVILLQFQTQE